MFQVIAEVFSDGVAVLEVFLFEETIDHGDVRVAAVSCSLLARPSMIFVPMVSKVMWTYPQP